MANHFDLEEQEQLEQLKHFWKTWGTLISTVLILACGAVFVWNGYQYWQNRQSIQAAALVDAVDSAVQAGDQARVEQAFNDLKSRYAGTAQAGLTGLTAAKAMADAGHLDGAKSALTWVAGHSSDDGYKSLAKLRLASLLMGQKSYDEALTQLSSTFPVEFQGAVADRKGDILVLQNKGPEAIAEYQRAYKSFDARVEYRRLVEAKLYALGAQPEIVTPSAQAGGVK